jgi:putative oxidoreductase
MGVYMRNPGVAGLALRIGLGLFFIVFGVLKFVSSGPMTQMVYPSFWGGVAIPVLIYVAGVVQILGGVLLLVGFKTTISAIVLGVMHLGTVVVTLPRIVQPFAFPEGGPPNFLFFAAVPVLAAVVALVFVGPGLFSVDGESLT